MEYDGYNSDKTEDMFSDEEGIGKASESSPVVLKASTSSDSLVDNPLINLQWKVGTPNNAVIPKTPLSLMPFISKINGWTSDLETPESNKDHERTLQNDNNHSITESESRTPKNVLVSKATDEFVPASPVVSSKKAKKRTKRRIFNRESVNNSSLDQTLVPEENSDKENHMKKFKCIEENSNEKNNVDGLDTLVQKFGHLRQYSKFLIGSSEDLDSQNTPCDVREEDFILSWKALELADEAPSRKNNTFPGKKKIQEPSGSVLPSKFSSNDDENTAFLSDDEFVRFSSYKFPESHKTRTEQNDKGFIGFDEEEQYASRRLLSKFERLVGLNDGQGDEDSLSSPKHDVIGFTSPERMASIEAVELQRFFCEHFVDEGRELVNTFPILFPEPEYEPRFLPRVIVSVNTGFSTGNKKDISIDIEKIMKAKTVLLKEHSIDLLIQEKDELNPQPKISDENVIGVEYKKRKIIDDFDHTDFAMIKKEKSFEGKLCDDELEIEKFIWTPEDEDRKKIVPEKSEIISPESKKGPVVAEPMVPCISKSVSSIPKIEITGFQTGRKKNVSITEDGLQKAKNIFVEEFDENVCPDLNRMAKIPAKSCDPRTVNVSKEILENTHRVSKEAFGEDVYPTSIAMPSKNSSCGLPGFTSGRGKSVNISEEALLHARKVFDEDDNNQNFVDVAGIPNKPKVTEIHAVKTFPTPSSSGFTSGHGKSVNISENALLKAKAVFNEEFEDEISTPEMNKPTSRKILSEQITPQPRAKLSSANFGFMTSKGKSLKVSDEALAKAKLVFNEDFEQVSETCLSGFGHLKMKLESRSGKLHDPAKRKSLLDDITPLGRKKLHTNDLQARKLFDEADREDQELIGAAKYFEVLEKKQVASVKLNGLQDSSGKETLQFISDEVRASTAAFIEDIKDFSPSYKRKNWTESSTHHTKMSDKNFANFRDDKRPLSLPSSNEGSNEREEKNIKRSLSPNYHESIPDDLYFDSQYSDDDLLMDPSTIDEMKLAAAIGKQEKIIQMKKKNREKPRIGSLLKLRKSGNRLTLPELSGGRFPSVRSQQQLSKAQIDPKVFSINSMKAVSHEFNLMKFYKRNKKSLEIGIALDDEALLIPSQNHFAGVEEFKRSFLSSPGVDPSLLPQGWFENHYRWIVWKLAAMDKFNFQTISAFLTPQNVMNQLKYRYDREIDRSERPAIRRIMEKDDVPSKRMILCVSRVIGTSRVSDSNKPISELELTDGWYSIRTSIDNPLNSYVNCGKIKEGTKLMIHGAQLMNLEEGCHPLDAPESVRLKITTNSTRRAKWMAKLGYQSPSGPMELNLKDIHSSGGMIGKLVVSVARIYPVLYRERTKNGQTIVRNSRCEQKAAIAYEKECQLKSEAMCSSYKSKTFQDPQNNSENNLMTPRDVLPCLKIRVTDGSVTAIVTIWSNAEECSNIFKESSCIAIFNGNASGKRSNELQITAGRWTTFQEFKRHGKSWRDIICQTRTFTPLMETIHPGFSPAYGEFDTVGVVVSTGPAPHGMKNFETMNLAYRNDKNEDYYLSVLFWQGISAYGYSEIACVGALISCINLEWRKNTYRSLPTAFCSERTIISQNPKQNIHLRDEFEKFRERIADLHVFVMNSAEKIQLEVSKKTTGTTPTSNVTPPNKLMSSGNFDTPEEDLRSLSIKNRIEKLKNYGAAPSMSPICMAGSSRVSLDFRSPLPGTNASMTEATTSSHKKL